MGTNYYCVETNPDHYNGGFVSRMLEPMCIRRHIGKSSAGWCFAVRVYPELGITCLDDWKDHLNKDRVFIVDEYNEIINSEEFFSLVESRSRVESWDEVEENLSKDKFSDYASLYHFLNKNNAIKGPNNLFRRSGAYGYGDGPWDYLNIEFR